MLAALILGFFRKFADGFGRLPLLAAAIFTAVLSGAVSCQPPQPPQPPPQPDADAAPPLPLGDSAPALVPCQAACDALALAGCREGKASDCGTVLAHIDGARLVRTPAGAALTCAAVATVRTAEDARREGIRCGGP